MENGGANSSGVALPRGSLSMKVVAQADELDVEEFRENIFSIDEQTLTMT